MGPARLLSVVADSVDGAQKPDLVGSVGSGRVLGRICSPGGWCAGRGNSMEGVGPAGLDDPYNSGYSKFLCITRFKNTMNLEHSFFNKVQRLKQI